MRNAPKLSLYVSGFFSAVDEELFILFFDKRVRTFSYKSMERQLRKERKRKMSNGLLQSIADNVIFVLVCVGVAVALFAIAYAVEK